MSYLVMARKWRPQTFSDLIGQEHVSETLKKAIKLDRIAHAYLFCGTRGVGKTTTARILARALNCEKGPTPDPCGVCAACKEIASGSSMDVIEIDGASNRGIDDIRTLRDNVQYTSMSGRYRVFIIDEVHMVTTPAFNALLKTLEEPPPNVVFIFATTEASRIPQTILSRCQRYDFRRFPLNSIFLHLKDLCQKENVKIDEEALFLIAKKADGSMRDALSLLDQIFSFSQEHIALANVQQILGLVSQETMEQLMNALANRDSTSCLKTVETMFTSGYDLEEFVVELTEQIRYLLFAKVPGAFESNICGLPESAVKKYVEIAKSFSNGDLIRMAQWANALVHTIRRSVYPRFDIELCLLKMINIDSTVSLSEIINSLQSAPKNIATPEVRPSIRPNIPAVVSSVPAKAAPVKETISAPAEIPATPVAVTGGFDWAALLDEIMSQKPLLGTFLSHGRIVNHEAPVIEIRFSPNSKFQMEQIQKKENLDLLTGKLFQKLGRKVQVSFVLDANAQPVPEFKPKENKIARKDGASFNQAAQKEPILEKIIDVFEGEVVESSSGSSI